MTVSSGFFNSVNHDRLYDAEQLSSIFDGLIIDGVYENIGDAFQVSVNPEINNAVLVGTGRAWFDHTWTVNDSVYSIQLASPNEAMGRIDAIVLDVNREQETRANSIKYIAGSYASSPQKPTLLKSDLHNQYPLAYITIPQGSDSVISNSNIENAIGTAECPIVTGVLEALNLDLYTQQMEAEFNEWWNGIKDTLDENIVTSIINQVNDLNDRVEAVEQSSLDMDALSELDNVSFSIVSPQTVNKNNLGKAVFLPNGNIAWIARAPDTTSFNVGISFPIYAPYLNLHIVDKNGSRLKTDSLYIDGRGFDGFCVLSVSDTYPCDIYLAASKSNVDSDASTFTNVNFYVYKYTITSDNIITRTQVATTSSEYNTEIAYGNAPSNSTNGAFCLFPAENNVGSYFMATAHKGRTYREYYATAWIVSSDFAITKTTVVNNTNVEWGTSTGSEHQLDSNYNRSFVYMNSEETEYVLLLPLTDMSGTAGGNGKIKFDLSGEYSEDIADNGNLYTSLSQVKTLNTDVEIICNETEFGKFEGSYKPVPISEDTYPLVLEYSNSGNGTITNTIGTASSSGSMDTDVSGFTNTGFTLMFSDKKRIMEIFDSNGTQYGTFLLKNGSFGFSTNGKKLSKAIGSINSVASMMFQKECIYESADNKVIGIIIPGTYVSKFSVSNNAIPTEVKRSMFVPTVLYIKY